MRELVLAAVMIAGTSHASAQFPYDRPGDPPVEAEPHTLSAGLFGGVEDIASREDWGAVRYATVGADTGYLFARRGARVGTHVASLVGIRTALDEPSFEEFGTVADRFALTYAGMVAGLETRRFGITVTAGAVGGTVRSRTRGPVVFGGASIMMRLGAPRVVAFLAKVGSTDAWLADRNLGGLAILHERPRFRVLVGAQLAVSLAPRLLTTEQEVPGLGLGVRVDRWPIPPIFFAVGGRLELGGTVRGTFVGGELTVGRQLPIARLVVRRSFGR